MTNQLNFDLLTKQTEGYSVQMCSRTTWATGENSSVKLLTEYIPSKKKSNKERKMELRLIMFKSDPTCH